MSTCISEGNDMILRDLSIGDNVAVDGVYRNGSVAPRIHRCRIARNSTAARRWGSLVDSFVNLETHCELAVSWVVILWWVMWTASVCKRWNKRLLPGKWIFTASDASLVTSLRGDWTVNGVTTIAEYDRLNPVQSVPLTYAHTNLRYLRSGSWGRWAIF